MSTPTNEPTTPPNSPEAEAKTELLKARVASFKSGKGGVPWEEVKRKLGLTAP